MCSFFNFRMHHKAKPINVKAAMDLLKSFDCNSNRVAILEDM